MASHTGRFFVWTVVVLLSSILTLAALTATQGASQSGLQVRRNADEEAPDALIGTWIMNPAKSKYAGQAPKSLTRSFDYTRNGAILVSYVSVAASGAKTIGHWAVTLDGQWAPEFIRDWGATPFMMISLKRIDEHSFDWSYGRWGRVLGTGGWLLSTDGKTLTQTVTTSNAQGQKTTNVVVYDKQE